MSKRFYALCMLAVMMVCLSLCSCKGDASVLSVKPTDETNQTAETINNKDTKYETPFWKIWLPIVGAYIVWEVVKYKVIRRK